MATAEKIAMIRLTLLTVKGKSGRTVPVFLTKEMRKSIDMLISFNKKYNSHQKFIFSKVSASKSSQLGSAATYKDHKAP